MSFNHFTEQIFDDTIIDNKITAINAKDMRNHHDFLYPYNLTVFRTIPTLDNIRFSAAADAEKFENSMLKICSLILFFFLVPYSITESHSIYSQDTWLAYILSDWLTFSHSSLFLISDLSGSSTKNVESFIQVNNNIPGTQYRVVENWALMCNRFFFSFLPFSLMWSWLVILYIKHVKMIRCVLVL